jgi:hypothetical protein
MTKRKRLLLPFGAAEANGIELQNNQGFPTHYGQPERVFCVTLTGDPVEAGCMDAFRLGPDTLGLMVPFGTPIEIQTL